MKVLQVNLFANLWSTGKIAAAIGDAIIDDGGESHIAYGLDYKSSKSKLVKISYSTNLWKFHHYIISSMLDLPGWGSWLQTYILIWKIKRIKPDIIHLHHIYWGILNINIFFKYLRLSKIPVVWTFHDCWAMTGGCSNFTIYKCDKWKTKCHNCERFVRKGPYHNIIDNSSFNFKHKKRLFNSLPNLSIVVVSEWLKSIVHESFLSKYECQVIANGINTEIFKPRFSNEDVAHKYNLLNKFVIISVASFWSDNKGLFDFIRLRNFLPQDILILLVGLDENQILSLPKGISGIPKTSDQDELACLYSYSDVVVSLSKEETFGLTIVEGIACGTPAIVYDNTALSELITPDVGHVVENGNLDQVVEAIYDIQSKGKVNFIRKCREHAVNNFEHSVMVNKYLNLYKAILQNDR